MADLGGAGAGVGVATTAGAGVAPVTPVMHFRPVHPKIPPFIFLFVPTRFPILYLQCKKFKLT